MKRNQRGFTLIEIMMVVAIIGTLFAVAAPNVWKFLEETSAMCAVQTMQNYVNQIHTMHISEGFELGMCDDNTYRNMLKEYRLPINGRKKMGIYEFEIIVLTVQCDVTPVGDTIGWDLGYVYYGLRVRSSEEILAIVYVMDTYTDKKDQDGSQSSLSEVWAFGDTSTQASLLKEYAYKIGLLPLGTNRISYLW